MLGSPKTALLRVVAAVVESMNKSLEPRDYDDDAIVAEFSGQHVKTVQHLIKMLPTLPPQIRRHTVLAIGRLRVRSAAHTLFQLMLNEDDVASVSAAALADIAGRKLVQRALSELSNAHPQFVRYAIVEFLIFCNILTVEQRVAFLTMCISIALDQREGQALRSRSLEALAVCNYHLDKRTRLARLILGVFASLSTDSSKEVRASAVYALRLVRSGGTPE